MGERTNWHEIIQEILDHHLEFLSGKKIRREKDREYRKFIQVDYYCEAQGDLEFEKEIPRPLDHLKKVNIIEYKSIHEVLNEKTFRNYVGRALIVETSQKGEDFLGETTLTIFTTRKPERLLERYPVEALTDWKYRVDCFKDLEVYLLIQKEMRGRKEGEAMALLQVLEGEKEKQLECWREILSQDLENTGYLKNIIQKLNREVYMNFVKEIQKQQAREIAKKMLEEGISKEVILKVTALSREELEEVVENLKGDQQEEK